MIRRYHVAPLTAIAAATLLVLGGVTWGSVGETTSCAATR